VVTATKTESKISEVPTRVTVITAEQIRQQDAKDLSDVLRKEAGIDIVRSTASGVATVSIRGGNSGTQRSIILIDGEPADFLPRAPAAKPPFSWWTPTTSSGSKSSAARVRRFTELAPWAAW